MIFDILKLDMLHKLKHLHLKNQAVILISIYVTILKCFIL